MGAGPGGDIIEGCDAVDTVSVLVVGQQAGGAVEAAAAAHLVGEALLAGQLKADEVARRHAPQLLQHQAGGPLRHRCQPC